jgi:hypothetical protein
MASKFKLKFSTFHSYSKNSANKNERTPHIPETSNIPTQNSVVFLIIQVISYLKTIKLNTTTHTKMA